MFYRHSKQIGENILTQALLAQPQSKNTGVKVKIWNENLRIIGTGSAKRFG